MSDALQVTRTERGWAGHFICAHDCRFRRNTLIECGETRIVVSTVGAMAWTGDKEFREVGCDRYYETMAFHAAYDGKYWDVDVSEDVDFSAPCAVSLPGADDAANDMHEAVVTEIMENLAQGGTYPKRERDNDE